MAAVTLTEPPMPIRSCFLHWLAIHSADQTAIAALLGLANLRQISWARGVKLPDKIVRSGETRFSTVVVTPAIEGWTLVIGPWCGLTFRQNVDPVTRNCEQLSARFGRAQAFSHRVHNEGEAWLIAENGQVIRRWISDYPELAMGEPSGAERRLLDAYEIPGKPEDLDPDDERFYGWVRQLGDCYATTVAAESSLDPTAITPAARVSGQMLVADTSPFRP